MGVGQWGWIVDKYIYISNASLSLSPSPTHTHTYISISRTLLLLRPTARSSSSIALGLLLLRAALLIASSYPSLVYAYAAVVLGGEGGRRDELDWIGLN